MNVIINRYVAILKPKQPFLDWLESQADWDVDITLEELRADRCAYLMLIHSLIKPCGISSETTKKILWNGTLWLVY